MKTPQQILFPEVVLKVRIRFRVHTVVLRPLSLRQIGLVQSGLAEVLEISTGLSPRQLRKLSPQTISDLTHRVDLVNAWSPKDLAKKLEEEEAKTTPAESLEDLAGELVEAGHRPSEILDLTPEQFCFYIREARRLRARRELILKRNFTEAASVAVGTLSKEGTKYAKSFTAAIEKAIQELAPKT